jgi:hypothetical protein
MAMAFLRSCFYWTKIVLERLISEGLRTVREAIPVREAITMEAPS